MRFVVALIALYLFQANSFTQIGEELGPVMYDTELLKMNANDVESTKKVFGLTFDSTFYYISDTLTIPFFDEFTTDRSQTYNANYSDANVIDSLYFFLLDSTTSLPLHDTSKYMLSPTYIYEIDTAGVNDTIIENPSIAIKICDLTDFPVQCFDTTAWPRISVFDTINFASSPDTVWLTPDVSQDSARLFFAFLNDQEKLWLDSDACHNYRFPINPWSQGVRTFDGTDEKGVPYAFGNLNAYGIADYLTSKPINLDFQQSDSVQLSFIYQPKGLGNAPEIIDSLFLEFYNVDSSRWERVWSKGGLDTNVFLEASLMIVSPFYLKNGFQFRFGNYASLSGALDHWHIDYVWLTSNPSGNDVVYNDIAIMFPQYTLLDTYTSVPWEHYQNMISPNDIMIDTVKMLVSNNNVSAAIQPDTVGHISVNYEGANQWFRYQGSVGSGNWEVGPKVYDILVSPFYTIDQNLHDTLVTLDCEVRLTGTATDNFWEINDTARVKVDLHNYYAYDDGSAEAAYGPTGALASLAYRFDPLEGDSLLGVNIGFVPSVTDVSGFEFLLTVWDDNNGEPGAVLYEDDSFFPRYPEYPWEKNGFRYYPLADSQKLYIDGPFYVGWKQFDTQRLNVGMDLNRNNQDKIFYSVDNQVNWFNTSFEGSLLMRPIFDTKMNHYLGYEERKQLQVFDFNLYPNPTNNILNISGDLNEMDFVQIFDLTGKLVRSFEQNNSFNVTFLNPGIYIMRIVDKNGVNYNHKFIKN